jgi:hypothetical protein
MRHRLTAALLSSFHLFSWQVRLTSGRDQVVDEVLAPQALKVIDDDITRHEYKWTIIENVTSLDKLPKNEYNRVGLIGFNFEKFRDSLLEENSTPYLDLLIKLWPGDWEEQLAQLNTEIEKANRSSDKSIRLVTKFEWWRFIGIIISAAPLGKGGVHLWGSQRRKTKNGISSSKKLGSRTDYGEPDIMKYYRFREIKKYFPFAFYDWSKEEEDPWHPIGLLVDGFNENRNRTIAASFMKLLDELMSAFVLQTTALGGLPHLSYIYRKPKPLGTEGKVEACGETGELICLTESLIVPY